MHKSVKPAALLATTLLLSACASNELPLGKGGTGNLGDLRALTPTHGLLGGKHLTRIRTAGLQEIAMTLGAQSGLAARGKTINAEVAHHARDLDTAFNFHSLVLDHNVMPPVLVEGHNVLKLADQKTIRLYDRSYRILRQAQFITAPPAWRDYLTMTYKQPDRPDSSMLPRTHEEKVVWKHYVTVGWQHGVKQADNIFRDNLARLKRDYKGMLLYRTLLAQHMVTAPYVARTNMGVTGAKNELRVGDHVLKISALPEMQLNSDLWLPAVSPDKDTLTQPFVEPQLQRFARGPETPNIPFKRP